jgi:Rho GTPase-activating protein 1
MIAGLLYDVSLRAETNLMDARNLALVLAPTLIRGSNPMKDIEMCGIASESSTVASVLEICISQYPKVFKSDR